MPERFVLLARLTDPRAAQLAAARIESEGISVRIHGEWLGPYPMTVGAMAETELWVPESELEDARLVLVAADIDEFLREEED